MSIDILLRYISSMLEFSIMAVFLCGYSKVSMNDKRVGLSVAVALFLGTQAFLLLANHPILSSLTYFVIAMIVGFIILKLNIAQLAKVVSIVFPIGMMCNLLVFKVFTELLKLESTGFVFAFMIITTSFIEIVLLKLIASRR